METTALCPDASTRPAPAFDARDPADLTVLSPARQLVIQASGGAAPVIVELVDSEKVVDVSSRASMYSLVHEQMTDSQLLVLKDVIGGVQAPHVGDCAGLSPSTFVQF